MRIKMSLPDRKCPTALLPLEDRIEDVARDKYCGKEIGDETKCQGHGKTLDRPGAEEEQDSGRNDGGDVSIHNCDPGMCKTLVNRSRCGLTCMELFTDTLKNQHV